MSEVRQPASVAAGSSSVDHGPGFGEILVGSG